MMMMKMMISPSSLRIILDYMNLHWHAMPRRYESDSKYLTFNILMCVMSATSPGTPQRSFHDEGSEKIWMITRIWHIEVKKRGRKRLDGFPDENSFWELSHYRCMRFFIAPKALIYGASYSVSYYILVFVSLQIFWLFSAAFPLHYNCRKSLSLPEVII